MLPQSSFWPFVLLPCSLSVAASPCCQSGVWLYLALKRKRLIVTRCNEREVQILSKVDCTFVYKNIIWSCIILSHKYNPLGHKLINNRLDKGMSSGRVLLPVMSDKLCYFPYRSTVLQSKWTFNLLEQHDKEVKPVMPFQEKRARIHKASIRHRQGSRHSAGVTFQMADSFQI